MLEMIARWPTWYLVLIAYTAVLGLSALRVQWKVASAIKQLEAGVTDPRERGRLAGERAGGWARASAWLVGAVLLLTGSVWALTIVATGYVLSARHGYYQFAQGFAEGRKAEKLAAAHEYVHGRVPPRAADYVAAGLVVGIARILPLVATLVAMTWLPR